MESYRNKFVNSEYAGSKLSMTSLNPISSNPFQKVIQYIQDKYNERIHRLESSAHEFKNLLIKDPALVVMKENFITEKFIDQRVSELFHSSLFAENEKTISMLQEELLQRKTEILRLEQQVYSMKFEHERFEDKLQSSSRERLGHTLQKSEFRETFNSEKQILELVEAEKVKNEKLIKEMSLMQKELGKTRDIYEENQKLQRYIEQLEGEKEKMSVSFSSSNNLKTMIEAQKVAGVETIKELQNKFKHKTRALKKKIIDQKGIIENLGKKSGGLGGDKDFEALKRDLQRQHEEKENKISEKYKEQIGNLQVHYKSLLDSKVREIQEQIDPKHTNFVPQEQYFEICQHKNELENELIQLKNVIKDGVNLNDLREKLNSCEQRNRELENSFFILKTQQDIQDLRKKAPFNEKYESEVASHAETKFKLKISEENLAELREYVAGIEDNSKKTKENLTVKEKDFAKLKLENQLLKLNYSKVSKLRNFTQMIKSQNKNLKIYAKETLNNIFQDYFIQLKDNFYKISDLTVKENKNLTEKLKSNSAAFDKLQEEVKNESSKMKIKQRATIENALKEAKGKCDREVQELKEEAKKYKELFEKTSNSLYADNQSNAALRAEIQSLREEKEKFRAKLKVFEEKIETQTLNFKNQLKNKQLEIESLKKKSN